MLAEFAGDRVSFGGEGLARLRHSRGFACRRVPEEVLADPLFADVEDRADLVEGAAEIPELVSGAFAADPRGLEVESCAGFVQCLVPFGGRAPCLGGGGRGEGWCVVVVVEPAAACGGDAPDDGGPAASFTLAACSFHVAGLLVPVESPVVGGQESSAPAWFGQEAGQGGGRQGFRVLRQCSEEPRRAGFLLLPLFAAGMVTVWLSLIGFPS